MMLPEAVDHDARGERVLLVGDRMGELEAATRKFVVIALGSIGDESVLTLLEQAEKDEDADVRKVAPRAIQKVTKRLAKGGKSSRKD